MIRSKLVLLAMAIIVNFATAENALALEACEDMDLRNAQPGAQCVTSTGAIYERVSRENFGEAWKGPDGLIWGDKMSPSNWYDAVETCKSLEGELPSKEDFERGLANNFREVLPSLKGAWFYWASTVVPNSGRAYLFDAIESLMSSYFRSNSASVRCVAR